MPVILMEQTQRPGHVNWQFGVGTILQIILLLGGLAVAYGAFSVKIDQQSQTVDATKRQTNRIEHYLSSQDPAYYRKVAENGDADNVK